jgi:hypothetical protein
MSTRNHVRPLGKRSSLKTSKTKLTSLPQTQALYDASVRPQSRHTMEEPDSNMANESYSPSDLAQMPTSPSTRSVSVSNSDMIQGVVVTETGPFPRKSKYTGMSSGQVLAKSAEELFKHQVPHLDVMSFFCPLMSFGEEMATTLTHPCPLVDKDTADRCVNSK